LSTKVVEDEFLEDIFQSIEWMGLDWDSGPTSIDDFKRNWSQHFRTEAYEKQIQILKEKNLLFACECSRKILADAGNTNSYPGTCIEKNISLETEDVSWRIKVGPDKIVSFKDELCGQQYIPIGNQPGSFVIRRRDKLPGYHISTLTDDILYNVNIIVRGNDLLESTAVQLYLAEILGMKSFSEAKFFHHPLIHANEDVKLSKTLGSLSLKTMIQSGYKKEMLYREFAEWVHLQNSEKIHTLHNLTEAWEEKNKSTFS
jgi:glutamyl/glutaminyl-tRNA synthetase